MLYQQLKKLRQRVMERLTCWLYFPMLFSVYKPTHKPYSREALLKMPKNSLGNNVVKFIEKQGLKLIPNYELHDAKHVLTGYGTAFEDEIKLQFFELGNGNHSLPVWVAIVIGTVSAPDYLLQFLAAYRKGKSCRPITPDFLIKNISTNLRQLQQQLYTPHSKTQYN